MKRRLVTFLVAVSLFLFFPLLALADSPVNLTDPDSLQKHLPTPEQWQVWCIAFGPLAIAFAMRAFAKMIHVPNKKERKAVANVVILAATVVGLYLSGALDNFTPTLAALVYMFTLVHQSYDKLWQGIPGLNGLIGAIDPWSADAPQRTSSK